MAYIKSLSMHGFKSFPRKTEIPFTSGINVILGPNGSGKSSSYDTLVTLSTGEEIELGKIVEDHIRNSSQIKTLDDGIYVDGKKNIKILSLNKKSMKIEEKIISKFIRRTGDPLYKITTATGKWVKATGCHPVMIFKEGQIESTLIRDLKEGDLIASPRRITLNAKEAFDKNIARLLGYIIGDGYVAKDRIEFVNKDQEVIEDFKSIINDNFNLRIVERYDKNITRLYIRDKSFVKYIRDFFTKESRNSVTSKDKKIPKELLISDNLAISNILAGLYDTDGSVRKDIAVIELCTKNKSLAYQVQGLLLRFGIVSKVKLRVCCASNTKDKIKRDYFYIYISGKNNLRNFYDSIPLKINYKIQNILNHLSKETIANTNVDLLPKKANQYIKELAILLGIKIKSLRRQYPLLSAYSEDRCLPSRDGVNRILELFNNKLNLINNLFVGINNNQLNLIKFMDELNISGRDASESIGLNQVIIRRDWQTNRFNARPENLEKFNTFIQKSFLQRISRIRELMIVLTNLANSDIFWDKILKIDKIEEEKYVYDLTIEENHNFIANNIFLHNSNISDALCFVLGRLSIKSMRAAKARNLIFQGTKAASPAKEAVVEIIFDNSDKTFSIEKEEISIKRIVRLNGQSIYKINNETKTRQEVLSLLAQAGIDPNGFNIILQGEIQNFVKMHTEERRKIIEEVAGISIYESRKEKSMKELEKTEEKQKEVFSILRERTAYLNNLEKERQQALKYKKLEEDIKKFKASIIHVDLKKRENTLKEIQETISKKNKEIEKIKQEISKFSEEIKNSEEKIIVINKKIQDSTGFEQEKLNQEITTIRAEIAGLNVKIENDENKLSSFSKQRLTTQEAIRNGELELKDLQNESPSVTKKEKEISSKKTELEKLEDRRKRFYMLKSELKSIREKFEDKKSALQNHNNESAFLVKQIESLSGQLFDKKTSPEMVAELRSSLYQNKQMLENLNKREIQLEKISFSGENEIEKEEKIIDTISKMDVCPLCKSKITKNHIETIHKDVYPKIASLKKELEESDKELTQIGIKKEMLTEEIEKSISELSKREMDLIKIANINEKKDTIKELNEKIIIARKELSEIEKLKINLEKELEDNSNVEQKYETARIELQEISLRTRENVNSEISFKQREYERAKISLKQISREEEDIKEELSAFKKKFSEKESILEKKKKQEEELVLKFQSLIKDRDNLNSKIRKDEQDSSIKKNFIYNIEQEINNVKIDKAKVDAEVENLEMEMLNFPNIEIIGGSRDTLVERLSKIQEVFSGMGSVNLRSVEVYDEIKKEYDSVNEKANSITKEKESILRIIHDIDVKKKKVFLRTLEELNTIFSRNFAQISIKGQVSLELEDKKDPFAAGVAISVKTGHGKYFDVTSLSGGEQTMVALSLIFAIQELNPYCFYILDEIDAALDKRNSERLGGLLRKYMQKGQYIVISHNDEIITNATNLYGLSMHEGISKVISLRV
jgi:chromosome segregation protein